MLKLDEFPKGNDNIKVDKEALRAKLLQSRRERELSNLAGSFFPLEQENPIFLKLHNPRERSIFLQKLASVIRDSLSLNIFGDNITLKTECEEVLSLINENDANQIQKSSTLVEKLYNFFHEKGIFPPTRLP